MTPRALDDAVISRRLRKIDDSFVKMAAAGVIDAASVDELRAATGMRNVLVHGYLDVDHSLVSDALVRAPQVFRSYTSQVARWLLDRATQGIPGDN